MKSNLRTLVFLMAAFPVSASAAFTGNAEAIAYTVARDLASFQVVPGSDVEDANYNSTGLTATAWATKSDLYGYREAKTSADLSTATLGAFAYWVSGGTPGDLSFHGYSSATARLEDSFTHMNGSAPFTWSSSATARFNLDISGFSQLFTGFTGGMPVSPDTYTVGWVSLDIFQKGHLEAGLSPWGNAIASFGWGLTPESVWKSDMTTGDFRPVDGFVANGGGQLTAEFAPGEDFDWSLQLSLAVGGETGQYSESGMPGMPGMPYAGIMDYSHTVTVSYQAPMGADVYSSSGVFPNTALLAAVPEPETYALMLAGLGLVVFAARRRRT